MTTENKQEENQPTTFETEISKLPPEFQKKLVEKEKEFKEFVEVLEEKSNGKSIGVYINPTIEVQENRPIPNFDKLKINFLLDDFDNGIPQFDPKLLLQDKFDDFLVEEKEKSSEGEEIIVYKLKSNKNITFEGTSISLLRENCYDGIYEDLKSLGSSFVYKDNRGFVSALKTIDIHRNMLLQKFEKYVVVYAGAGSWLRGEKSNDFDVFVVIDDTDVKRMPRMQVKDQLTKIIWQMSREVAQLTGIQIHIQVYLLTDFWDALKDAHPVMFTFLRDGVPFYDRGIYSAWKELLKLGKIRPSAEAIDMHMNVGTQLLDRAKSVFSEIITNDVYNSVLSPSQAILMLKGYNPTTPKETVKMFKEVLLAKEKCVSQKDVDTLENTVKMFKKLAHDKETKVTGKDVDKMIKDAETFLDRIKKMFEEISDEKIKESIVSSYNEFLNQIRTLPGFADVKEKEILSKFMKEYIDSGKLPSFVKAAVKSIEKAKKDYDSGKSTPTEINKVLKEIRNVLSEIKEYRDTKVLSDLNNKKLIFTYDENKGAELINYNASLYLIDLSSEKVFEMKKNKFVVSKTLRSDLVDSSKVGSIKLTPELFLEVKESLKAKELFF